MNRGRFALLAAAIALAGSAAAVQGQQKRTTWDGVYTQAQAIRGAPLYEESCASCHGVDLSGVDFTPPVAGPVFGANYDTLPVNTLFDRIRVTMPLNQENSLGRQKYVDILAYMLSRNSFPPGDTELSSDANELNQITFLATRP
jgi:cytochrome c